MKEIFFVSYQLNMNDQTSVLLFLGHDKVVFYPFVANVQYAMLPGRQNTLTFIWPLS